MTNTPHKTGCRVCGDQKLKARGLCQKHYRRFLDKLDSLPTSKEKQAFEAKCLAGGWVEPKTKGGRPKEDDDPFSQIAAEVLKDLSGGNGPSQPPSRSTTSRRKAN